MRVTLLGSGNSYFRRLLRHAHSSFNKEAPMFSNHNSTSSSLIHKIKVHRKLRATLLVVLSVATIGYVTNHAGSVPQQRVVSEKPEQSNGSGSRIESFDVGLKQGRHRIQLGTDTKTVYRTGGTRSRDGVAEAAGPQAEALQQGWAQPLSMRTE